MKVGTDSLILGSWVNVAGHEHILDVGTGSGILALMLAQRANEAMVDAIEIDPDAASQAKDNVEQSPWASRIRLFTTALQQFIPPKPYSLIVSNPPYFSPPQGSSNAYLSQSKARGRARQFESMSPAALFSFAAKWLLHDGELVCIYPTHLIASVIHDAKKAGFYPRKVLSVAHNVKKDVYASALQFCRQPCQAEEAGLIIRNNDNSYTEAFRALCQPYYLNF